MKQSLLHDMSKFSKIETDSLCQHLEELINTQYGSKRYKEILEQEKDAIMHHYKHNIHHPEYHNNDYTKMSLYDIIEMYVDFKSSVKKNINGNIDKSFEINKIKFQLSDEIIRLMKSLK
jgi:hypothetical protein